MHSFRPPLMYDKALPNFTIHGALPVQRGKRTGTPYKKKPEIKKIRMNETSTQASSVPKTLRLTQPKLHDRQREETGTVKTTNSTKAVVTLY